MAGGSALALTCLEEVREDEDEDDDDYDFYHSCGGKVAFAVDTVVGLSRDVDEFAQCHGDDLKRQKRCESRSHGDEDTPGMWNFVARTLLGRHFVSVSNLRGNREYDDIYAEVVPVDEEGEDEERRGGGEGPPQKRRKL